MIVGKSSEIMQEVVEGLSEIGFSKDCDHKSYTFSNDCFDIRFHSIERIKNFLHRKDLVMSEEWLDKINEANIIDSLTYFGKSVQNLWTSSLLALYDTVDRKYGGSGFSPTNFECSFKDYQVENSYKRIMKNNQLYRLNCG